MSQAEIAVLITTYQRPQNLRRVLESVRLQRDVAGRMEVVVCDDGSTDDTPRVVEEFARSAPFHVGFTTHEHSVFQAARCRNEAVRASRAPYLLFLDGDCIVPPDHVRTHLERRKPRTILFGDCCRFDEATSQRIALETIANGEFVNWAPASEVRRLRKADRRARLYRLLRHRRKPKLISNNMALARCDYERVNGMDENYRGWGCEDDDLGRRLRKAGVAVESVLRWTWNYHLWHPRDASVPDKWNQGQNVAYFLRQGGLTRCRNGLLKRTLDDLSIRMLGSRDLRRADGPHQLSELMRQRFDQSASIERPEVEILVLPGSGQFTGRAECNVLVALDAQSARSPLARQAHLLIGPVEAASEGSGPRVFPLNQWEQALAAVA